MSLLMLLLARVYAPLGARGALVDGLRPRSPVVDQTLLRPRSATCTPFPSNARRAAHARTTHARHDDDSLAA
jgi:hypothetical protein